MLLLNTASLEKPFRPTDRPRPAGVDSLVAGFTGALLGLVVALVSAAVGSAVSLATPVALLTLVFLAIAGCFQARREYRRGEEGLADFLLATVQAGCVAGLGMVIGLACSSLLLMQIAFVAGLAGPSLIARLPVTA